MKPHPPSPEQKTAETPDPGAPSAGSPSISVSGGPLAWLAPRQFPRSERRWIVGFTLALMVLTTLPYALLATRAQPGTLYPWLSTFHFDDYFQYFAWARHIAHGEWLIRNYYTPADQAGFGLFNPFFLVMGWLYKLTGNPYLTHHLLRLVAVAVFGWVSYAFAALFLPRPGARRWAQVLVLGGGLEFPAFFATIKRGIEHAYIVSPVADIYPYKLLYRTGHLTACLVLLLVIAGAHVCLTSAGANPRFRVSLRQALIPGFAALLLGLINPYYIVLLAGLLGLHALVLCVAHRTARPLLVVLGPAVGSALASAQYAAQSFTAHLGAIAMDDRIDFQNFALFFAIILPLAGLGLVTNLHPHTNSLRNRSMLVTWAVFGVLAVASPIPFHVRLLLGYWVALAIPAAATLDRWGFRQPVVYAILLLLCIDPFNNFRKEARDVETGKILISTAALEAFDWLDTHAPPDSVVLAHALAANPIPAYANVRVLIGHSFQTANYYELHERVLAFYSTMTAAQQREFIESHGVDYIMVGPEERPLTRTSPSPAFPGMVPLYNNRGYEIWGRGE